MHILIDNNPVFERWNIHMHYLKFNEREGKFERKNKITVSGTGNLSVNPNLAFIQMEVFSENQSLSEAQQENTKVMGEVIGALTKLGISHKDMQTAAYTIQPKYDYSDGKQVLRGHTVRNAISVKISQIEQAGKIIDTAVEAGVNRITNIRFTVENSEIYYDQALKFALEDAMRKAEIMAGEMRLYLNPKPVSITENVSESPNGPRILATAESATPIEPGQLNIKAVVTVRFSYE